MVLLSAAKTRHFYHEEHVALQQSGLHLAAPTYTIFSNLKGNMLPFFITTL
jgi:hypothetical protein